MAPRRVAAALASDDDTLADSIRASLASGDDQGSDDSQDDQDGDSQDGADQGDDQQDDQGADDQQDDQGADDQQQDDGDGGEQRQPLRTQRRAAPRERDDDEYISPAAQRRIDEANRIATETAARLAVFEQQFAQPRETREQEAARLATMTPEQVIDYKVNKALGGHSKTVQAIAFNAQNTADKASFDAQVATNPQLKRFAADVEKKHSEFVRRAQTSGEAIPSRQAVLTFMLGERALEMATKLAPQQQQRQQRVERQRVRPGASRSDVSPTRSRGTTVEQRLENVQI